MTIYSHNGGVPAPLPHQIFVPDGSGRLRSRTRQTPFTEAEIAAAGYVVADAAPSPTARQLPAVWNGSGWTLPAKSLAVRKAAMRAAARARYGVVSDGGSTATIAEGVTIAVSTSAIPALRLMRGKEHMTAAALASMPVVTSAGAPVTLRPTIAGVMLAAIDAHVAACEATQNALVAAILAAADHDALDLIDVQAGTVDGQGGWP